MVLCSCSITISRIRRKKSGCLELCNYLGESHYGLTLDANDMKYHMLAGYLPFAHEPANPGSKDTQLRPEYICDVPLSYPQYFSSRARDLVNRMVVIKPQERANLREVAQHSWLSDYALVVSDVN